MPSSSAYSSLSPMGFAPTDPPTPSPARRFADSLRSGGLLALLARCSIAALVLHAAPARAQGDPPVGVRAAGMAGAFTAVADDATAAIWNPAGLATGSYASLVIDGNAFSHQSAVFAGFGSPPLALTYVRTATAEVSSGRKMLVAHDFGVTLVQSIGDSGVSVGTTLKAVHGVTSVEGVPSTSGNAFDADAGVMVSGRVGQIGLVVRNIGQPFDIDRKVRAGASVHVNDRIMVASDVEFTKATTESGTWRDAAMGIEAHPLGSAWLRAGVHWNTAGGAPGAAPIAAFGASYAIRGALMADAQASVGSVRGNHGWGIGLRFAF